MVGPQLVRSFSSRQLSLVSGGGRVVVFAVLGGRHVGPSLQVHIPTAARLLDRLPGHIETVVFIDEPVPDAALISLIDDMVAAQESTGVDVVANFVPAVEVVDRRSMQRAIGAIDGGLWINPAALISSSGGSLQLFGGTHSTAPARD